MKSIKECLEIFSVASLNEPTASELAAAIELKMKVENYLYLAKTIIDDMQATMNTASKVKCGHGRKPSNCYVCRMDP